MKTKTLSVFALSIFTVILLASFISATITIGSIPELERVDGTFKVNISSDKLDDNLTISVDNVVQGAQGIAFTIDSFAKTWNNETKEITVRYDVSCNFIFSDSTFSTLRVFGTESPVEVTKRIDFKDSKEFCAVDNIADLRIKDINFNLINGFGDDEEWYPLSEIEVEIELENNGNWDVEDIEVEWELLDGNGNVFMDDDEGKIDLDEGDDDTIVFTITLDDDIEDLEDDVYTFRVKATGEINDKNADELDGENTCVEDSQDVEVILERDFAIIDNLSVDVQGGTCSNSLSVSGSVWNIGRDDQDDVELYVYNSELGVSEVFLIGDIDSLESERFQETIGINNNFATGSYRLQFSVLDEDGAIYENRDDDEATWYIPVQLNGCGNQGSNKLIVSSSSVQSGGNAGEELVLKLSLANTESSAKTYNILINDYSDWASSAVANPTSITIPAGSSGEVLVSFDVDKGVSGNQRFEIQATSNGNVALLEEVSVNIKSSDFVGLRNLITKDNWYLWVVGALNVILLLVIIIVVVRIISSRK